MYEQYLQLSNIPCGAVLNRIMIKEGISQSQLAERSGIVRQRICDYLANRRRITVEASLNLEKALQISIEGFFYRIQANHDVYTCVKEKSMNNRPNLKHYRKAVFWDTDIEKLDALNVYLSCHGFSQKLLDDIFFANADRFFANLLFTK